MNIFLVISLSLLFALTNICRGDDKDSSAKSFSASIVVSGLYQSGNTYKFITQGKGELKYSGKIVETIFTLTGTYGENRGVKDDNLYLGTFNADFFYEDKFSPFILQYLEYNFSKGIDLRSQSGAGLKYTFIQNPMNKTSVSMAFIYDHINLFNFPGNSNHSETRFSFRFKTKQELFDSRMIFNFMTMFQPASESLSNYNLFIDSVLEFPLNKLFKLNANYSYGFSNVVSVNRKRADNRLTFGFGIYF